MPRTGRPKHAGEAGSAERQEYLDDLAARKRAASARLMNELAAAGREIGPLPEVENAERREKSFDNLRVFLEEYFPEVFNLRPWSAAHLACIAKMETAIEHGGQFALALPRGQGKTSIATRAALWALLTGRKKYVVLIGANEDAAGELLDALKTELEFNPLLLADWPEVCYPLRKLEGNPRRAVGQTLNGERTMMNISAGGLTFPTIEGVPSSGACVESVGILARLRGLQHMTPTGQALRPDLVILDDPQTDESAASPEGNEKRLRLLNGPVLGLAGPGRKISAICPCTVIRNGDMADQLLTPEKSPAWTSERHKLLPQMPNETAMKIWVGDYRDIWAASLRETGTIDYATRYYAEHREEMDAGAVAGWEARYNPDEISAIQNAMNLYLRDKQSFFAEYQNEPQKDETSERGNLRPEHIAEKITGQAKGFVPQFAEHLILAVDVQQNFLPWLLFAVADDFTGHVVDYGAWPEQKKIYYRLEDANPTLERQYPNRGLEARTYAALNDLCGLVAGREYQREDGTPIAVDGVVIDAGWGRSTDIILQWARECEWRHIAYCFKGMGIGPQNKSLTEYRREPGLKIGINWQLKPIAKRQRQKLLLADVFFWKSFLRERILTPRGDTGALTICGKPDESPLIIDALTSEFSTVVIGNRRVDKWMVKPGRTNNHLFDCLDMAHVCASVLGCQSYTEPAQKPRQNAPQGTETHDKAGAGGLVSTARERVTGRANYPPKYEPKPRRPGRISIGGKIEVKY